MKDSHCFACAPVTEPRSEVAWQWHPPRVLCRAHTTKVRTIDGELLFDRLQRLGVLAEVLEGSIIGRAIQPLSIDADDGRRLKAWAGYGAGTCVINEDRFGAINHFEARMMEFADTTDLLYVLRHADPPPCARQIQADPLSAILAAFSSASARLGAPPHVGDTWSLAGAFWNEQRRIDDYMAHHSLSSAADAAHFTTQRADMLRLAQVPQDMPAFTARLFELSRRRFA